MKYISILFLILLLLLTVAFQGCKKTEGWNSEGDYFYLENEGATMPVWVTGNTESGVFIITNHGGPGGGTTGHDFHKSVYGFQALERDYALVYWDQRMTGMSTGDVKREELNIDQHVEDLDQLVSLIVDRYSPSSLFMFGHSWGGGLSIEYLGREDHQQLFKGWIDEDGSIEDSIEHVWKREWILPRAEQKLEETGDDYWAEVIQWYADNPFPTEADNEPYEFVGALGGYVYDLENAKSLNPNSNLEAIFASPYALGRYSVTYSNTDYMAGYSFEDNARNITIPSLLIYGKEDGAVPIAASEHVYNLLATDEADKTLIQLDACAHSPHFEKPFEFYDAVKSFVETYK